jgi:uncharacterized paraquat-inducible protein A
MECDNAGVSWVAAAGNAGNAARTDASNVHASSTTHVHCCRCNNNIIRATKQPNSTTKTQAVMVAIAMRLPAAAF